MKQIKFKNRAKGSVLVAVIGILAVMSAMAIRFNVEMETAMIKTGGRNLASDVKILANSGLMYCIAGILKNGNSCAKESYMESGYDHVQLAIEEELEMRIKNNNVSLPEAFKRNYMGSGAPVFGAQQFNATRFYNHTGLTLPYIPEEHNLSPGEISFLVEDLSGKLPVGHVSQWFQRHLISAALCKLVMKEVPIRTGFKPSDTNHYSFRESVAELFEETIDVENGFDKREGRSVYLRSMLPYAVAKLPGLRREHLNTAGIPLADGILALEELGSSYSWVKNIRTESEKKHATDAPRNTKDYLLLAGALTPFSRFIPETKFTDRSSDLSVASEVTYASINPMVMYHQNERLYYALFNYEPVDPKLRMYFSVSFDPQSSDTGVHATDDNEKQVAAMANRRFFETNFDGRMLSTVNWALMYATSSTLVYNARNTANDIHPFPMPPFDPGKILPEYDKRWGDAEFLVTTDKESAYFIAMAKAINRLSRAFKGTMVHELPAENMMCPIMTRKTLEFAIIQAVFGDSILFVVDHKLLSAEGTIDYLHLFESIQGGKIDLSKIKFVENAFSKCNEPTMSEKYFVSYWNNYDEYVKSSSKYFPADEDAKKIKIPSFGLYYDGIEYVNYLPHPQTDQRALHNTFVTVAAAFSVEKKSEVNESDTGDDLDIRKLYEDLVLAEGKAARDLTNSYDAYIDLETEPPYTIGEKKTLPEDNYIKLFNTYVSNYNFLPADFTPYETKVRLAVLVNLLNAIIPSKISPSKNVSGDINDTLFSTSSASIPKNLKDIIYFKDGQYWFNNKEDVSNPQGLPKYLNGWTGGIRTPGMTFWKYGVHSTTFQITVDAFKYDDAARLSTVVTFDAYDDTYNMDNTYDKLYPETKNNHSKPKFELTSSNKYEKSIFSVIYLNPKGRADQRADNYVIGNGVMRYPTPTNTDSWRILSSVWSKPFGKSNYLNKDYFTPIVLLPEEVLNVGPDGGNWHFEPHSYTDTYPFTKFFKNKEGESSLFYSAKTSQYTYDMDYSTGVPKQRKYSFGKNSWLQWKATFSKEISSDEVEILITREPSAVDSNYVMDHRLTLTNRKNGKEVFTFLFSTSGSSISPLTTTHRINLVDASKKPVAISEGDYDIRLTELKDSDPAPNQAEKITKIVIRRKPIPNGYYSH